MSNDIQIQIKSKIAAFAGELESLVRQAAIAAVGDALGASPAVARASTVSRAAVVLPIKSSGPRRQRRSAMALEAAADHILKHIKTHPGQRAEDVRSALGIEKNVWVPAIGKLVEKKQVAKKGQKRATTYTAK
jgi:hypothetical protein